MTNKTQTQYQHLEPRPGRITGSYSSRADGSGRPSSIRPSTVLIRSHRKNLPRSTKFPWTQFSKLSTIPVVSLCFWFFARQPVSSGLRVVSLCFWFFA
jgi:hypothetical protein